MNVLNVLEYSVHIPNTLGADRVINEAPGKIVGHLPCLSRQEKCYLQ